MDIASLKTENELLKGTLQRFADHNNWDERTVSWIAQRDLPWEIAYEAIADRPQPARNRTLPETRCDCCDNGLDDAWEFCPFCGQQHPDAAGALACRPQGERSET